MPIKLLVNGEPRELSDDNLIGLLHKCDPKFRSASCGPGATCLSCTVTVDGVPEIACALAVPALAGRSLATLTGGPVLVEYSGAYTGRRHDLNSNAPMTIGRHPDCDVVIKAPSVSRRHATIFYDGAAWRLSDVGSSNGTFVNGHPRGDLAKELRSGDLIRLGATLLKFWTHATYESVVQDRFYRLATIDMLTGALNRQQFLNLAEYERVCGVGTGKVACVMLLDLDKFKSVNDTYGHKAGDRVLVAAMEAAMNAVGDLGMVGRLGGEEFAVFLSGQDMAAAESLAERIRMAVSAQSIALHKLVGGQAVQHTQTVSIGLIMADPNGFTLESMLQHADELLYEAKRGGRNRVVSRRL